jgi:hypothetical protein
MCKCEYVLDFELILALPELEVIQDGLFLDKAF